MSKLTESLASFCEKHPTVHKCALLAENIVKKPVFGCQDCGQCVLSYNSMVCCMRCPKRIRNGPCGGTRADGHCEVYPERPCIWWLINKRAKIFGWSKKLRKYHKPVNNQFEHTSAWVNMFAGKIEGISLKNDIPKEDVALPETRKK